MSLIIPRVLRAYETGCQTLGKPMAALLGALDAQMNMGVAAIGGKDSMSGSLRILT